MLTEAMTAPAPTKAPMNSINTRYQLIRAISARQRAAENISRQPMITLPQPHNSFGRNMRTLAHVGITENPSFIEERCRCLNENEIILSKGIGIAVLTL